MRLNEPLLVLKKHILLQNLDVGFGSPQSIQLLHQEFSCLHIGKIGSGKCMIRKDERLTRLFVVAFPKLTKYNPSHK